MQTNFVTYTFYISTVRNNRKRYAYIYCTYVNIIIVLCGVRLPMFIVFSGKTLKIVIYRSNHQKCSIKKGVFKNFAKFTGKHLCQSLLFNLIKLQV